MSQERIGLGLDDDGTDLEDLIAPQTAKRPVITPDIKGDLESEGAKLGFTSRDPIQKKKRPKSPFIVQKNIKMRIGMPELLSAITKKLDISSDQETLERALGALLEKEGLDQLQSRFNKLTTDS